jgi:integrase
VTGPGVGAASAAALTCQPKTLQARRGRSTAARGLHDRPPPAADDSLVFVGPKNAPLRRPNFSRAWRQATEAAELTGFHIHDLRYSGNHFAAATGASMRELMGRMGHSTTRAALVYQHRTAERDCLIATAMTGIIEAELAEPDSPSGTQRARGDGDES